MRCVKVAHPRCSSQQPPWWACNAGRCPATAQNTEVRTSEPRGSPSPASSSSKWGDWGPRAWASHPAGKRGHQVPSPGPRPPGAVFVLLLPCLEVPCLEVYLSAAQGALPMATLRTSPKEVWAAEGGSLCHSLPHSFTPQVFMRPCATPGSMLPVVSTSGEFTKLWWGQGADLGYTNTQLFTCEMKYERKGGGGRENAERCEYNSGDRKRLPWTEGAKTEIWRILAVN